MFNEYADLANKLKLLGHPVRLQMLDLLRNGEICVCHIERTLNRRQAYVSQHLMTLREAGLVTSHKRGLQVYYRLADEQIIELLNALPGLPSTNGHNVLEDCPCPACSTIPISSI